MTLSPSKTYIVAQAAHGCSGEHLTVQTLDLTDLLANPRIASWGPRARIQDNPEIIKGGVYRWSTSTAPDSFVNAATTDINDLYPIVGFQFESDFSLADVRTNVVEVSTDGVTFSGTLDDTGGDPDVLLAFEWGTDLSDLAFSRATPEFTSEPTSFAFTVTGGLTVGTTYYYRAVAINEAGRAEGLQRQFTFTPLPDVDAMAVTSVTDVAATLDASLVSPGTEDVTARGFCQRETAAAADTETCESLDGPHLTGAFTVELSGLIPTTSYTVRAFATNSNGDAYSDPVTFTTRSPAPSITSIIPGDEQAIVSFSPSAGSAGLEYELAGSGSWIPADDATSPLTIEGLTNDVATSVRIRFVLDGVAGMPSSPLSITPSAATTIAASGGSARLTGSDVVVDPDLSIAGGEPIATATVTIENAASGDALLCATPVPSGRDCTFDAATGVLSLSGLGDAVTYEALLRGVRFTTTSDDVTTRDVRFRLFGETAFAAEVTDTRSIVVLPPQTITLGLPDSSEFVYGETLSLSPSASSGLDVTITVSGSGCTLDGPSDDEYSVIWTDAGTCTITATQAGLDLDPDAGGFRAAESVVSTITTSRRPLIVLGLSAIDRVYDGSTAVMLTGTPAIRDGDVLAEDASDVLLEGTASGSLSSPDAGEDRPVTIAGLTLSGARSNRYELGSIDVRAEITRRPVTITGSFTVAARGFDGTTDAAIQSSSLALSGVVTGDTVTLTPVATFDRETAGTAIPIRLTGSSLGGGSASNYRLDLTGAPTTTAAITRRILTVSSGAFTVANKVYDRTDAATVTGSTLTLAGFAPGESMADITWAPSARFRVVTAGTGRVAELVGGNVLGGARGDSYTLDVASAPTATATITPRPVTVAGASAGSRPYDGTTAVSISGATLTNVVAGDAVTLTNAAGGAAASRDAGTHGVSTSMALAGADAANYTLTGQPAVSVTITPLPVSVTMNALPARPYDGTTALPLDPGAFSVSGVLAGESIAVSGTAQLSSRVAGTRVVTLAAPTFTPGAGTSLANYTLPGSVSGTVTVTTVPLTVAGATVTQRAFDGSTTATVTGARLEGVRAGDNVSLTGAGTGVFASAQPGTHAVSFAPTLVGVDAASYTLVVPPLTGTIVAAPATLRITGGLTQFADGSPRSVRAAVSPAGAGRIVITYPGGSAPSAPGAYPVSVTLDSTTHAAQPLSATLTVEPVESLLLPGLTATNGTTTNGTGTTDGPSTPEDEAEAARRREALLARIAVRTDGTLALPEIGPVLEADGTAPAFAPREHRVLEDGEPSTARVIVVEEQRVRVETEDASLALELQASIATPDGRAPLPVDADGTLLLDRGGFVEVGGSGFLAGSTAEVWMFSTATFLGTAIVGPDGSFDGAFLIDDLLEAGEHTIQLNGTGADQRVRSTSLGVRIDDLEAPSRERVVLATAGDAGITATLTSPLWLALLAAALGAGVASWWFVGRRRRDEAGAEAQR